MKLTLLGTLAAVAAAATLCAFGFATTAAAQDDKQPTHAELVQRWADAAIEAQLKGMKTSLRLSADQEKLWGPFECGQGWAKRAPSRPAKGTERQLVADGPLDCEGGPPHAEPGKSREDRRGGQAVVCESRR